MQLILARTLRQRILPRGDGRCGSAVVEFRLQSREVVLGESPFERRRDAFVLPLERQETLSTSETFV